MIRPILDGGVRLLAARSARRLEGRDAASIQSRSVLPALIGAAKNTKFGRDHRFSTIRTIPDFREAVPLRTYEQLWADYLGPAYPVVDDVLWPGRIPYFALTSGTTRGPTKYIPVTRPMLASNRRAGLATIGLHIAGRPGSKLFGGRLLFLGGSTALSEPAPGVRQGDLSGIAASALSPILRPFTFPPVDLALDPDWDRKIERMAIGSVAERITLIAGVPSWLLSFFRRVREVAGRTTIAEVWPSLEVVVHGGVAVDPYRAAFAEALGDPSIRLQDSYACSEGFLAVGDPASGLLRLLVDHGIFYEFVPVDELSSSRPTRLWLGDVDVGRDYAVVVSTCAGMWAHVVGDVIRFESTRPPLIRFVGRTSESLSAFGEHLIGAEIEAAMAAAALATGAILRDWHAGPAFDGVPGYHRFLVEFGRDPESPAAFRDALDDELGRRNADYRAHRCGAAGLPSPALGSVRPGGFDAWMRSVGKFGGQHKLPRVDGTGALTGQIGEFLRDAGLVAGWVGPGPVGQAASFERTSPAI